MLENLTLIFVCQLLGEVGAAALSLPVPGPVAGMVILFVYLAIRGEVPVSLGAVSDGLLASLSLLFVPAGVGVMLHLRLLQEDWIAVSTSLLVSTLCTIAVTALVMVRLSRSKADKVPSGEKHG